MSDYKSVYEYLHIIGWTPSVMAEKAGISVRACQRWISHRNETPEAILCWLDTLATAHERAALSPPPDFAP